MANIKITWTNPADVSDQDTVEVYRASGDETASSDEDFRTAAGTAIFSVDPSSYAGTTQDVTDTGVSAGTYTYGAFSKNAAGFGPGDLADSTITIS